MMTSQEALTKHVLQWQDYFQYQLVPAPQLSPFTLFTDILSEYITSLFGRRDTDITRDIRMEFESRCWSELNNVDYSPVLAWIKVQADVQQIQYRAAQQIYGPEIRWIGGYSFFMIEENKQLKEGEYPPTRRDMILKWNSLAESERQDYVRRARCARADRMKSWIALMDQVEVELSDWSNCH